MCFKDGNGEGSSDPAPRPSRGGAYHGRSSGGRQHVGQNQRDRHDEQHDTPESSNAPPPPPPLVPTASMPPPAPPLPPSRRKPSSERSISPSRVTEFYPGPAASPSAVVISSASDAIARCLRHSKIHWAVVGGACCVLLGSPRETDDIDIVVSKPDRTKDKTDLFPPTRYDPLEIQVLCFPSTFKIAFDSGTEVLDVNGVYLLTFAAILNSKCGCIPERSSETKRVSDTQDIVFILLLAIKREMRFGPNEVPNATEDFQNALEQYQEGVKQCFQAVGL